MNTPKQSQFIKLAAVLGLPELQPDKLGTCTILIDEDCELSFQLEDEDTLTVHANIGSIQDKNNTEIFQKLLQANLFWTGTSGATISFEPTGNAVFLAQHLCLAEMSEAAFKTGLETFVATVKFWREELAKGQTKKETPPDTKTGFRV